MVASISMRRFLLLVLVAAGIIGMHTLGHPDPDDHEGVTHHTTRFMNTGAQMPSGVETTMTGPRSDANGAEMLMNPLNVCVAVLVGGIMWLLVGLLGRNRRGPALDQHVGAALFRAGRGPPDHTRLGLHLADLSVQRT